MKKFVDFLKNSIQPNTKKLGGFFIGEKVLFVSMQEKFVYIAGDFVTASKLKRGLEVLGKKIQIVSCGRENEDERDVNLFSFARAITRFEKGGLDGLIFLPSSLSTKFDLQFLRSVFSLKVGEEIGIENLTRKLVDFGFERVDYVTTLGQFAVRGDVVDVFVEDHPTRIEFFDDEIEKIINFDFSTMKTLKKLEKVEFFPIFLKNGNNSVLDLGNENCSNIFIDEPVKIENECNILEQSRENEK